MMRPKVRAYLQLHSSVILFGFTGVLGAVIPLSETVLVWYRVALTTLGYVLYLRLRGRSMRLPAQAHGMMAMVGAVLIVHWLGFYGAVKLAGVSLTLVCMATTTLFTALLGPLFSRQRLSVLEVLLGVLILVGMYLIYRASVGHTLGILIALGSALLAALYGLLNKPLVARYPAELLNLWQIGYGWAFLTVLLPLYAWWRPAEPLAPADAYTWFLLLVMAWVTTNLAYELTLRSLVQLTPFAYVLAINLEPIYAIALDVWVLGKDTALQPGFLLGASMVLGSVFLYPLLSHLFRPNPAH